jgi:eukaryotic-like serine/threonine-protein kinase
MSLIGQSLGRYHILEQLGEGGMAIVYKAYDTRLEKEVAVKVIRTEKLTLETMDKSLKRFAREAKALARLTHPNIIPIIDYGEEEGAPYLVMDFIPGGTLKRKLSGNNPIEWQEAAKLLTPIIRALDYAHKQKIIHRDIKPSNILITESGEPMLTDFGIAKIVEIEETADLTGTSMGVGTPEYMAPEQVSQKITDHRVDIYATGIILYEMVTGRKPFRAETPLAVLLKHASEPLPRPTKFAPNLPKNVEHILLKALAKDPKNRYQNMGDFALALEKLANRQGKAAPIKPKTARDRGEKKTIKPVSPRMVRWITIGIIAIALVFGATRLISSEQMAALFPTSEPTFTLTPNSTHTPVLSPTPQSTFTPISTATPTLMASPTLPVISAWERPGDGMTMSYIPAGEFNMGSNDGNSDEQPLHTVYLDAFWIDQTEVTNAMYAKCVQNGKCNKPRAEIYYGNSMYENHPVVYVSWYDAQSYCEWSGGRLPTEAQWEKAARGRLAEKKFPWGNEAPVCQVGAENGAQYNSCNEHTSPVGSFSPNGYGLYDMSGNVREWVNDWYDGGYYAILLSRNPSGPSSGEFRVLRGGSRHDLENHLRSAYRSRFPPSNVYLDSGFRCSRSQ